MLNFLQYWYFCIPFIDDAVRVSLFQYIIAVYPLLFIVLTYVWIRWYSITLDDYRQDDLYPDWMVNPGEYIVLADESTEEEQEPTVNASGSTN